MRRTVITALALTFTAAVALAQHGGEQKKPLSPAAKAEATIGGKNISVAYSAPSKRGRTIFGTTEAKALVPYGQVWRTGANAATTLKTDTALTIGGLAVPAGTYTLFTVPGANEWTLIVNKQTGQWGTNYDQSQDLGRVKMKVRALKDPVETFAIAVKPVKGKDGNLTLTWDNTEASVPVVVR